MRKALVTFRRKEKEKLSYVNHLYADEFFNFVTIRGWLAVAPPPPPSRLCSSISFSVFVELFGVGVRYKSYYFDTWG